MQRTLFWIEPSCAFHMSKVGDDVDGLNLASKKWRESAHTATREEGRRYHEGHATLEPSDGSMHPRSDLLILSLLGSRHGISAMRPCAGPPAIADQEIKPACNLRRSSVPETPQPGRNSVPGRDPFPAGIPWPTGTPLPAGFQPGGRERQHSPAERAQARAASFSKASAKSRDFASRLRLRRPSE